jgi:hypothetical protein
MRGAKPVPVLLSEESLDVVDPVHERIRGPRMSSNLSFV